MSGGKGGGETGGEGEEGARHSRRFNVRLPNREVPPPRLTRYACASALAEGSSLPERRREDKELRLGPNKSMNDLGLGEGIPPVFTRTQG